MLSNMPIASRWQLVTLALFASGKVCAVRQHKKAERMTSAPGKIWDGTFPAFEVLTEVSAPDYRPVLVRTRS